ncbi:hypothetical protein APHNP_0674 [Anaplasma phagocytophilum str. ApNP]|uniref:Uncharacterized protein n=1 Tax=Anaplasma phagocytophilum str. ApNP TaxID=1359153 RepID=A0A0F3NHF8_ANAPH|nr:hypothetical protein APHNP_0674 [Anaplasma phagocytophilum str. ApNP]
MRTLQASRALDLIEVVYGVIVRSMVAKISFEFVKRILGLYITR